MIRTKAALLASHRIREALRPDDPATLPFWSRLRLAVALLLGVSTRTEEDAGLELHLIASIFSVAVERDEQEHLEHERGAGGANVVQLRRGA